MSTQEKSIYKQIVVPETNLKLQFQNQELIEE